MSFSSLRVGGVGWPVWGARGQVWAAEVDEVLCNSCSRRILPNVGLPLAEETFVPVEWKFLALLTSDCELAWHQDQVGLKVESEGS